MAVLRVLLVWVLLLASTGVALGQAAAARPVVAPADDAPEADPAPPEAHTGGFGGHLGMGGVPRSAAQAALAYQVTPWVEVHVGASWLNVPETLMDGVAMTAITPLIRSRLWPFARHSLILDLGAGLTRFDVRAEGQAANGNSMRHHDSGLLPVAFVAGGYGVRTVAGFRASIMAGYGVYGGRPADAVAVTGGAVDADTRAAFEAHVDSAIRAFIRDNLYAELGIGWMF